MVVRTIVASALLIAACGTSSGDRAPGGTVEGVVLSAPSCPVERAESPCPPRRVPGAAVVAVAGGHRVSATRTDARGRFQLDLPLGRFTIVATNIGGYASQARRLVIVRSTTTTIRLVVDSGIR